jgi:hypothetical protein
VSDEIVELPTMGGSLPLFSMKEKLGVAPIILPLVNADNNQHAEVENLSEGNLLDGIRIVGALMTMAPSPSSELCRPQSKFFREFLGLLKRTNPKAVSSFRVRTFV